MRLPGPGTRRKLRRYAATSGFSVVFSLTLLACFNGVAGFSPVASSVLATIISALPAYHLHRRWTWGRSGASRLWREVVPFWAVALAGLAASSATSWAAQVGLSGTDLGRASRTGLLEAVYIATFGVLWCAKFAVFDRFLFGERQVAEPAG